MVQGHVTCLSFPSANVAIVAFKIQKAVGSVPTGSVGFHMVVNAGGSPEVVGTGFDQQVFTDCNAIAPGGNTPITVGNIRLHS